MANLQAVFELRGVRQHRGGRTTLSGVDLDLPANAVTALVGPSGAGKTSLLRLLNRLDDPTEGSIAFAGQPIAAYPVRELRRRVGFVFQTSVMFDGTVADNLRVACALGPNPTAVPNESIASTLALVGLDADFATREALPLSGGERQRVGIARALMTKPEVLLMDEPTSALDPEVADRLMATVSRLSREAGLTIVMVTHRLAEARLTSTHLVMLEGGRVIESGATDALFSEPTQPRTRAYLGL